MKKLRLVVLSGPSGSGKSTAIKALEDMGFFCVDNLPVALLPKFLELLDQSGEISKVATVVDVREREFLKDFPAIFSSLKDAGYRGELIFLDASDHTLVRRFSETRRRHPLGSVESPLDGIRLEREMLRDVQARADRIIDTSAMNVHELRSAISEYLSNPVEGEKMSVNLVSFGYRYGTPSDADLVMDVRFLPNPYFVEDLKHLDGRDPLVRKFVSEKEETSEFISRLKSFLDYLVPLYWKEGKSYLTIAIGCTGGRHRSVVITDILFDKMGSNEIALLRKRHRDIDRL
ncbi:MAG: RNase adapter RapZ [Deltaproteobacteria bacterium]|nr:RNase adapter RapZ [Deltaproteobacteria bacterium]